MNQNGFCSQIPARRSAQTEQRNSFKSRINREKTAVCSERVSEQRKLSIAGEEIRLLEFSPTLNSFTSLCFNPPAEILPLVKSKESLAVIWGGDFSPNLLINLTT